MKTSNSFYKLSGELRERQLQRYTDKLITAFKATFEDGTGIYIVPVPGSSSESNSWIAEELLPLIKDKFANVTIIPCSRTTNITKATSLTNRHCQTMIDERTRLHSETIKATLSADLTEGVIVVIDDVTTTGASLTGVARYLRAQNNNLPIYKVALGRSED